MNTPPPNKVKVFIGVSPAKKDRAYLHKLKTYLAPLVRNNSIEVWSYEDIVPGRDTVAEVTKAIAAAQIAILLLSADFFDSAEFEQDWPLLAARAAQGMSIFPVITEYFFSTDDLLERFHPINEQSTPISGMETAEQDKVWVKVAKFVQEYVKNSSVAPLPQTASPKPLVESPSSAPSTSESLNMQEDEYDLELTGDTRDKLVEALISAFPSKMELKMMVRYRLEKNLSVIAGGENLNEIAFNLVAWAESHGKVKALVRGASETNKGNRQLKAFKEKYLP